MIDLKKLLSKVLIAIIIFLISIIYINSNPNNGFLFKKYLFSNSWSFNKAYKVYKKILGKPLFIKEEGVTESVFNEYNNSAINKYLDGVAITYSEPTIVKNIQSGIVVFIGEKEGYGKTVIVQGSDGVDIWYANVTNINPALYDFIEQDDIIAEPINNLVYVVLQKNKEYLNYEEYLKNTI